VLETIPKLMSKPTLSEWLLKYCRYKCQKRYCQNDCLTRLSKLLFNTYVSKYLSIHCWKNSHISYYQRKDYIDCWKHCQKPKCQEQCQIIVDISIAQVNIKNIIKIVLKWLLENLTPKIPCVFLPISAIFDLLGGIHFYTKKSMRTWGSNCRKLPCWTSTSENYSSSFHAI
jgi:hypothetical protein